MQKTKTYHDIKFTPEIIQAAIEVLTPIIEKTYDVNESYRRPHTITKTLVLAHGEGWDYDQDEEFFADYRKNCYNSMYILSWLGFSFDIRFGYDPYHRDTSVAIKAPERGQIEAVFEVFERNLAACKLPPLPEKLKPKPVIFIGHGGSTQWRDLKDHLQDKHGYEVEAYEIGARAGHAIRDILEEMLDKSSFAILVMTGEDKTESGEMLARQNVIHELGLFQGKLGFNKTIVLLEEGTEEFSNIHGINQIRYGKENIRETFGEVLATLRREFSSN